jgi:hypothetical protein
VLGDATEQASAPALRREELFASGRKLVVGCALACEVPRLREEGCRGTVAMGDVTGLASAEEGCGRRRLLGDETRLASAEEDCRGINPMGDDDKLASAEEAVEADGAWVAGGLWPLPEELRARTE